MVEVVGVFEEGDLEEEAEEEEEEEEEVDDDDDDDDIFTHPFNASAKIHEENTGSVLGFFGWSLIKSTNLSFLLP